MRPFVSGSRRGLLPDRRRTLPVALLCLSLGGCVALRPLEEVQRASEDGSFLEIDGVSVHYQDHGEGDAVVLLHGFGASTWSWRKVLPSLSAGHRTIALDLPGFGASERPRALESYERDRQVRLVHDLLEQLDLDRVHLVGHSFGGALAMTFAHRHPQRVESLILVDSAAPDYPEKRRHRLAGFPPAVWLWVRGVALRRPMIARVLRRSVADESLVDRDLVDGYRERLRVEGAVRAFRGLTQPPENEPPDVPFEEIEVPTLAIWGSEDQLILPADAREATARFPNARFVEIPGCGHLPMEECPEQLVEILQNFLEER